MIKLTLSLPNMAKGKFRPNFQISFSKILRKKIVSCESTGRELSFEWSHHSISFTDSKVRVTLQTLSNTMAVRGLKIMARHIYSTMT